GLPGREITIAELARTKGYATAAFGKWHLGSIPECRPNAQGFDLFLGHFASCIDSYSHMYYASEPWYYDLYRNQDEVFEDGVHMTDLITRETLKFIDDHRDGRFLIYVSYNTPHYPMVSPGNYIKMYAHLPRPRQLTAALVAGIDESIGQVMARLRERKLLNDTLVIFASDNGAPDPSLRGEGGGSNSPYREYKRSLFDGGIRVPGAVSWPGIVPAGVVCGQPVIGMDIFATTAEAIGADLPNDRTIDGRSWFPLFKDRSRPVHDALFFEWADQHAVRMGRWKLVENGLMNTKGARDNRATGQDSVFLADVTSDPGETRNLRAASADVAARLCRLHEQWREQIARDPTASPDFSSPPR
ncbi:MAG: sulfatase-like hydrolase/transferase, partial [Planctomycetes bacterium]|nr:sulfatase-like hydrolase/transferase [Planctomycetota bacterium]